MNRQFRIRSNVVRRGVDVVFEQHGTRRRATDFRTGQKPGARDHLTILSKPVAKPDWMREEDYLACPAEITVQEVKVGKKVLVTTFLSPAKEDTAALWALISQIQVGDRPGRIEPRLVKRRPRQYFRLRKPRWKAREEIRRYGHPKKLVA